MKSAIDMPILLSRKVANPITVESRIMVGKDIVNIKSSFDGKKKYSDILFDLACRKLGA